MENQEKLNKDITNKKESAGAKEKAEFQKDNDDSISKKLNNPDEKRKLEKEINKDMLANSGLGDGPSISGE